MKNFHLRIFFAALGLLVVLAGCGVSSSGSGDGSDYPRKAVTLMLPYGAGGPTDLFFREFARIAEEHLGQKIIIRNETGGGGLTMYSRLAKAKPDGYTMAAGMGTTLYSINPHLELMDNQPEDFDLISSIFEYQHIIAASTDAPYQTFEEFIEYSKENHVRIASPALTNNIFAELINKEENYELKWDIISYDSGAEAAAAVLGGHADIVIDAPSAMLGSEEAGDLNFLVVLPENKMSTHPDVPTLNEFYDLSMSAMIGIGGPAGLPDEVIEKWDEVIEKTLKDPELIKFAENNNYTIVKKSKEEVQEYFDNQREQFGQVIDRVVEKQN